MSKVCPCCKQDKPESEYFRRNCKKKDGAVVNKPKSICKVCDLEKQRIYREKNKETLAKRDADYYQKNKEHKLEVGKKYVANNRVQRNVYIRVYKKVKRETDPSFKVYENVRKRIWKLLTKNKSDKSGKSKELLGCELDQYRKWLEFTFEEDMTWDNYGSYWHIDHVKPLISFDLSDKEAQHNAFHWTNTRAMTATNNLKKGDSINKELIEKNKKDVESFKTQYKNKLEMGNPQPILN